MEKNITLTKVDDFLKYLHPIFPRNFVEDGEAIPENSCSYNDTFKAFRINDASSALKGSLQIYLGELSIGDKIDVSFEVMNISGTKAKLAIDYVSAPYGETVLQTLLTLQSEKNGEFEKIGGSFVSTKDGYVSVVIGTFTADIGDFYVRNVDIKVKSKNNINIQIDKAFRINDLYFPKIDFKTTNFNVIKTKITPSDRRRLLIKIDGWVQLINGGNLKPIGIYISCLPYSQTIGYYATATSINDYKPEIKLAYDSDDNHSLMIGFGDTASKQVTLQVMSHFNDKNISIDMFENWIADEYNIDNFNNVKIIPYTT